MILTKPIKKIIEIECWDCGIKEHRHRTESTAMYCIDRQKFIPSKILNRQENGPFAGLSTRAANCLVYAGCVDKESSLKCFRDGLLSVEKVKNMGRKSYSEIKEWLGVY